MKGLAVDVVDNAMPMVEKASTNVMQSESIISSSNDFSQTNIQKI